MAVRPYKVKRSSPLLQLITGGLSAKVDYEKGLSDAEGKKALLDLKKRELDIREAQNAGLLSQQEAELEYEKVRDAEKLEWEKQEFKTTEAGKAFKSITDRIAESKKDKREFAQQEKMFELGRKASLELQEAGGEVALDVEKGKKDLGHTSYQGSGLANRLLDFAKLQGENLSNKLKAQAFEYNESQEGRAIEAAKRLEEKDAEETRQFNAMYELNKDKFDYGRVKDMVQILEDRAGRVFDAEVKGNLIKYTGQIRQIVDKPISGISQLYLNAALWAQMDAFEQKDKDSENRANYANKVAEQFLQADGMEVSFPKLDYRFKPSIFPLQLGEVETTGEPAYKPRVEPSDLPAPPATPQQQTPNLPSPFESNVQEFLDNLVTKRSKSDWEATIDKNKEELKKTLGISDNDIENMKLWLRSQ